MASFSKKILNGLHRIGIYISTLNFAEKTFADNLRSKHIIHLYRSLLKSFCSGIVPQNSILDFIRFCFDNDEYSFSQVQQDLWVLHMLGSRGAGFFVEFGAADGLEHSNTYTLEKNFGWDGILIEPVPQYFERLNRHREVNKYCGCVAIDDQARYELLVPEYGQLSSIYGYHDADLHAEARKLSSRKISVQAYDLNYLLTLHAPSDGIIDYLSIDVEGAERAILERVDFQKWKFRTVTVEHNSRPADMEFLSSFFEEKGYVSFPNDFFTANEYWFWLPELCSK